MENMKMKFRPTHLAIFAVVVLIPLLFGTSVNADSSNDIEDLGPVPNFEVLTAAPSNDHIADAIAVASLPFTHSVDTTGATMDVGDPAFEECPLSITEGSTVWYTYTPGSDGIFVIDTIGSDFFTVLQIFQDLGGGTYLPLECNTEGGSFPASLLTVDGTASTDYLIGVGGNHGMTGNLTVNIAEPGSFTDCSSVDVPQSECEALVSLYNTTDGPSWFNQLGWLTTDRLCSWYGIVCSDGYVETINQFSNNMTGELAVDFSGFPVLWGIELSDNQLSGEFGTILGNLPPQLEVLYLSSNNLSGPIPSSISNFYGLLGLKLSSNQLTGDLSAIIDNMPTSLYYIYLDDNQFTGTIPASIGNFNDLSQFDISQNSDLSGTIALEIINLEPLWIFDFEDTALCEPDDPAYDDWEATISSYTPGTCNLGPPDLTIDGITIDPQISDPRENVTVTVHTSNLGEDLEAWFFVDLYIDRVPTGCIDLGDYALGVDRFSGRSSLDVEFSIGDLPEGDHDLYAYIDEDCLVAEADEANNDYGPEPFNVNFSFPEIEISSPPFLMFEYPTSYLSESYTFTATAMDLKDGDLSSSIQWTSHLDGTTAPIGSGGSVTSSGLVEGFHLIDASVADSDGNAAFDYSVLFVSEPPYISDQTMLVKDVVPGERSGYIRWMLNFNGEIFFGTNNPNVDSALWKSDGTDVGTILVMQVSIPIEPVIFNNELFFLGVDETCGYCLWKSNGTEAGTTILKDLAPHQLTVVDDILFFYADDGIHGSELWKSDGTVAGTVMVKDIRPGSDSSRPLYLTEVDGMLFFHAIDPVYGSEVFISDGTETGTRMVANTNEENYSPAVGSFSNVAGALFFIVDYNQMWKTDGTELGTELIFNFQDIETLPKSGYGYTPYNGILYFKGNNSTYGYELWRTDGTEAGTIMVKDINVGSGSSSPRGFTLFQGSLYFIANSNELWKTDGTETGTVLVETLGPLDRVYSINIIDENYLHILSYTEEEIPHDPNIYQCDYEHWIFSGQTTELSLIHTYTFPRHLQYGLPGGYIQAVLGSDLLYRGFYGPSGQELWSFDMTSLANDPTISIQTPQDGAIFAVGNSINFSGSANDPQDGDLSANIEWVSNLDGLFGTGASISTDTLSVGFHTITATVTDSDGYSTSAQIIIRVSDESIAPAISILEPEDGSEYDAGILIFFTGTASDVEEGDLSDQIFWHSDINGYFGAGESFASNSLSVGTHTITATVTDSFGLAASDQIFITVNPVNTAPNVEINLPTDGFTAVSGESVSFDGTATDAEDGDLTASLSWTSDLDGQIGTGGAFSIADLSVGAHLITATVTDSGGMVSSAQVSITVFGAPTIEINLPVNGDISILGESVSFSGTAIDVEDGDLTPNLVWTSDIDGLIGTGGAFAIDDLSIGTHVLSVTVTDSDGLSSSTQISITVFAENTPPTITINAPSDGGFYSGDHNSIYFSGSASDNEEGDISAEITWTSDIDGFLFTGEFRYLYSILSMGTHTITATVTDSYGLSASVQISITVYGRISSGEFLSGSPQEIFVNTTSEAPFQVIIKDQYGTPIPGVAVTFSGPSLSPTGTFIDSGESTTTAITDADGIATSALFTASRSAGSYEITASISSVIEMANIQVKNVGWFEPYTTLPAGIDNHVVAIGDFNADGLGDIAVGTNTAPGVSNLMIFLQLEDGSLSLPTSYSAGYMPKSIAVGDLNNDGLIDIALGFNTLDQVGVYLQNEEGTLDNFIPYSTNDTPDSIKIGDLNNDGLQDMVVSHWNAGSIGVLLQQGDGSLGAMVEYPAPNAGYDEIDIGDLNHDGLNDVVKMNGQGLNPDISVFFQNQTETFYPAISYNVGESINPTCLAVGDVTGDGRDDIVLGYGMLGVFVQNTDGSLMNPFEYSFYGQPEAIELGDVNLDGKNDVVGIHRSVRKLSVTLQNEDGSFAPISLYETPYLQWMEPQSLALGDINGDGLIDAVVVEGRNDLMIFEHIWVDLPPEFAPESLSASNGLIGQISVNWEPVPNAQTYDLYRDTDPNGGSMELLAADLTELNYIDLTATPLQTNFYWVTACNSVGCSDFSFPDGGYALPPAPAGGPSTVSATDGLYPDKIEVTWETVPDATQYQIFRDTNASGVSKVQIGTVSELTFTDTSVLELQVYYYWITACNITGCSSLSTSDSGYAEPGFLFQDGFETGDFSQWSLVNLGGGFLTVCPEAAMNGSWGACVDRGTNDNRKVLIDDTPVDQTSFSVRFNVDINSFSMPEGTRFRFLEAKQGLPRTFFLVLRRLNGQYQIQFNILVDGQIKFKSSWYDLSDIPHTIEINWHASSGPAVNDGFIQMYMDGTLLEEMTDLDNDTHIVSSLRIGFIGRLDGSPISGIWYVDDVATSSMGSIGVP
jgi:ELWxxDGT repeat protein